MHEKKEDTTCQKCLTAEWRKWRNSSTNPSCNVFNIESAYYSNMRTGYYMRCGKWLLRLPRKRSRFHCFLILTVFMFPVVVLSFSSRFSLPFATAWVLAFVVCFCMPWNWAYWVIEVLCKCYGNGEWVCYTCWISKLLLCNAYEECIPINGADVWDIFIVLFDDFFCYVETFLCVARLKILH